jgi:GNAT superfamily N-acetyltransferase
VSGGALENRWRVGLREPSAQDADAMDPWLSEAIAAVQGRAIAEAPSVTLAALTASLSGRERLHVVVGLPPAEETNVPIGLTVTATEAGQPMVIRALAIRDSKRNLGYGAEAVYELEDYSPHSGLAAHIPASNGLAVYFWLRAGFRPAFPERINYRLQENRFFASVAPVWMRRDAVRAGR